MGNKAPSEASIDALFEGARSATIRMRAPGKIDPASGPVLLELTQDDLPALRQSLSIVETDQRFHCMCRGDLSIDLRGRLLSCGTLSFHHGQSLRVASWSSDAPLRDGPALLRLLAARGIPEPLEDFERAQVAQEEANRERERWVAATPEAVRESKLDSRSATPAMRTAVLDKLRAALGNDVAVAHALFAWLAVGRGPWSGYAAYEGVPIELLAALPPAPVIQAALALDDDDGLRAAARFFGSHELVTFSKSVLGDVPAALFERARPLFVAAGNEDDLHRFDHAAKVAQTAREAKTRKKPYAFGSCIVLGESVDGPLSGLARLANGALVSCDVKRIVRFDPGAIAAQLVAEASEHFVVLGAADDRVVWATMNASEIHEARKGRITRLAADQHKPVELTVRGDQIAWISRDGPKGHQIVSLTGVLAQTDHVWMLTADDENLYFVSGGFGGKGAIHRLAWVGGRVDKVCAIPEIGPSMATPRLVPSRGELLLGHGRAVQAIDLHTGKSRPIIETKTTIWAIAADGDDVALIIGDEDEREWSLARAPRDGGAAVALGSFARAPYDRHSLVIADGKACTVVGDKVLGAALR